MKKIGLLVLLMMILIVPFTVFGKGDLASTFITNLNDSNLINDGTSDNNKRFIQINYILD